MDVGFFALGLDGVRACGLKVLRAWGLKGLRACGFEDDTSNDPPGL